MEDKVITDVSVLLNIPVELVKTLFELLSDIIIHRYTEDKHLIIPDIGEIKIKNNSFELIPDNSFKTKLQKLANDGNDPLIQECTELLSNELLDKFKKEEII